jgi:hypothetical protein
VNTVRIVTVRAAGRVQPFCAILRLGAAGRRCDNWSTGGLAVAVDLRTGRLGRDGFYGPKFGTRARRHPDTGVAFEGLQVPWFAEAASQACRLHAYFYGFHSIGWDIAIAPGGPVFLEGNDDWGLQSLQGPHGGLKRRFAAVLPKA